MSNTEIIRIWPCAPEMTNNENLTAKAGNPSSANKPIGRKCIVTVNQLRKQSGTTVTVNDVSFSITEAHAPFPSNCRSCATA